MKRWKPVFAAVLVCALLAAGTAALAAGSSDDPLVSLGYLNQVFAPTVYEMVDQAVQDNEEALKASLDQAIDEWDKKLQGGQDSAPSQDGDSQDGDSQGGDSQGGGSASFQVVTLSMGQTLTGEVGCEVMLRIGTAVCVTDYAPGLIDTTDGTTLNDGGDLQTNHLYMVTIPTRGVTATADVVKVLARGSYTVN